MRAGVLSDEQIIAFLNENFINTWVPNSELGRVPSLWEPIAKRRARESKTFDTTHPLAHAIMTGWKEGSPVDCLVISSQFEVMGRQPVNELFGENTTQRYLTFLKEALDRKFPGWHDKSLAPLLSANVVLNNKKTTQDLLGIFRTPEAGYQDYTAVGIDAIAFEDGGILTIDIWVGHAKPAGSFDLYSGDTEFTTEGKPRGSLASVWGISPGKKDKIIHHFNQGKHFKLGVTGDWFSEKGSINAFLTTISVEPASTEKVEH